MSTPELLKDLLLTILSLQKELRSDEKKVKVAQEAYQELLDWFYEEYEDMIASEQYEAAKSDPDYFIALIQLAYYYQGQSKVDSDDEQSLSYFNWKLFTQIWEVIWQRNHASGLIRSRRKSKLKDQNHL